MHLQSTLSALLTLSLAHPALSAGLQSSQSSPKVHTVRSTAERPARGLNPDREQGFNPQISLYDFGPVGTARGYPLETLPDAYDTPCSSLREGEYACGSFEEKGVDALRAIYRCQGGVMTLVETCHEGGKKNRCARNWRGNIREWRRFYPFVDGSKGFCVQESQI